MIVTKTPLRVSFVGGGSDIKNYYSKYGGAVISCTIDKYIYITVNKKFDDKIRLVYSRTEDLDLIDEIDHDIIRNTLKLLNITNGIEITSVADIPSKGTGLGSSSAFTVGLLHALKKFTDSSITKAELGKISSSIEIDLCQEPIGKQDQYASAFGGFNLIEFLPDDSVEVHPINLSTEAATNLEKSLMIFYTGISRNASDILGPQSENLKNSLDAQNSMKKMVTLAYDLQKELISNNHHVIGDILHENWMLKKSITESISNTDIDHLYDLALKAGASGGKLLGAGAGGFLMFYVDIEKQASVKKALSHLPLLDFSFEQDGSQFFNI
jgi:D-glycero-alpha-D-manno-heptose-7-phosphate kinase